MILQSRARQTSPVPTACVIVCIHSQIKHSLLSIYCKSTIYFYRHNNILCLLNFNITYIITLLHVSTLMSHLQALISRTIVHIVLQFFVLQFFVLVELLQ